MVALVALAAPLQAGDLVVDPAPVPDEDSWEFSITPYGWLPWIDITTGGGTDIEIDGEDVLDSLQMTAQFELGLRKGKWGLTTDVFYAELEFDLGDVILDDLDLQMWLVTPRLSYRAREGNWGYFDLQAGARYTNVDVAVNTEIRRGPGSESASGDVWDFTVGFRGRYHIDEHWYLGYYGEIGAGESDLVTQAFMDVGYRWEHADLFLGVRYVYFDFPSNFAMQDLSMFGPVIGARFTF